MDMYPINLLFALWEVYGRDNLREEVDSRGVGNQTGGEGLLRRRLRHSAGSPQPQAGVGCHIGLFGHHAFLMNNAPTALPMEIILLSKTAASHYQGGRGTRRS